jgi:Uma2 family endonuclease
MPLVIDEVWLPATLTAPPMTDEQFAEFCAENPDYFIEMTADGELVIMPPNFSLTGARNQKIGAQLENWAERDGRGTSTDASSGFALPNGARRSPDAAWTLNSRLPQHLQGFWHFSPDFVIELRSDTDRLSTLRAKMYEWIENGTQLGWLIDPERKAVEVYRTGQEPEIREGIDRIAGEGPVEGFELDLQRIWEPVKR